MSDWTATASAVVAGVGLIFTGAQLRLTRRDALAEQRLAIEGVAVSWEAREAPNHAEPDGLAEWLYEIRVNNPGRFPIDNVSVRMYLPIPVRRVRYSGRRGDETTRLRFDHPVLAGGARRAWKRKAM